MQQQILSDETHRSSRINLKLNEEGKNVLLSLGAALVAVSFIGAGITYKKWRAKRKAWKEWEESEEWKPWDATRNEYQKILDTQEETRRIAEEEIPQLKEKLKEKVSFLDKKINYIEVTTFSDLVNLDTLKDMGTGKK